jgi:hypothetical protein
MSLANYYLPWTFDDFVPPWGLDTCLASYLSLVKAFNYYSYDEVEMSTRME